MVNEMNFFQFKTNFSSIIDQASSQETFNAILERSERSSSKIKILIQ